ncbi:MAG TPA: MBL fold metallo-hydrolase [Solirubrobacteraceae bacterium]|nr:MBL fold metallo-hydrolase [Solirubrobacteraceae bacterium]
MASPSTILSVLLVGGPTAVLEYGGLRLLTDPTFDAPGEQAGGLTKLTGPAVSAEEVGPIDAVLLSHDQHSDNLDVSGRAFLARAGRTLTTTAGAERLGGNAVGLEPWAALELERPAGGGTVTVAAVPAQHGPEGCEPVTGPVVGFVLTAQDAPTLYVSGDNASVDVVRTIAERLGPIELAVLFAGGVSIPQRFDGAYLTLSAERAAQAAEVLGARAVVPVHFEGWAHFTQGSAELREAFEAAGIGDRLVVPERGASVSV